jgi:S-adenosylmethionine decarboxylase
MTRIAMPAVTEVTCSDHLLTDSDRTEVSVGADQEISASALTGCEWIVDAAGCTVALLQSADVLRLICESVIDDLGLQVVGEPLWHKFPGPGGVTGLYLLAESHLACHTWPEHRVATFNLFCCRRREEWPWKRHLEDKLQADAVHVRIVKRGDRDDVDMKSAATSKTPPSGALR